MVVQKMKFGCLIEFVFVSLVSKESAKTVFSSVGKIRLLKMDHVSVHKIFMKIMVNVRKYQIVQMLQFGMKNRKHVNVLKLDYFL